MRRLHKMLAVMAIASLFFSTTCPSAVARYAGSPVLIAQSDEEETEAQDSEQSASDESSAEAVSGAEPGLGSYGDGRVSLLTIALTSIATIIGLVILCAIPISFTAVFCACVWQFGMLMRGGRKPDIG